MFSNQLPIGVIAAMAVATTILTHSAFTKLTARASHTGFAQNILHTIVKIHTLVTSPQMVVVTTITYRILQP